MAIEQAKRVGADLVVIATPELADSYERAQRVSEPVGTVQSCTTTTDRKGRFTGETTTTESTLYETRYVYSTVNTFDYSA